MKTIIGIPCMSTVPYQFTQSMLYLEKAGISSVCMQPDSLVYDARNLIALTAINEPADRVMWFDSDMVFMPDTFHRLEHDMDSIPGCEMVSGLYVKRRMPTVPVIYDELAEPEVDENTGKITRHIHEYINYPRNQVFPVKACGFGCVLTTVKLLRHVFDVYGQAFLPLPWAGEDLSFCHRVNQLGYTIYCDSNVSCGHIGTTIYTEDMLKRGDDN